MFHEKEEKEKLKLTCFELTNRTTELLKETKMLEEHKKKSISLVAQGDEKFERISTMDRESGDRRRLGYEFEDSVTNSPTYAKGTKLSL